MKITMIAPTLPPLGTPVHKPTAAPVAKVAERPEFEAKCWDHLIEADYVGPVTHGELLDSFQDALKSAAPDAQGWVPDRDETVMVSIDGKDWHPGSFIGGETHVLFRPHKVAVFGTSNTAWNHMRPISPAEPKAGGEWVPRIGDKVEYGDDGENWHGPGFLSAMEAGEDMPFGINGASVRWRNIRPVAP